MKIKLQGVSFSYAEKKLFSDVNLSILPRDKICIQGENGSGKTTLIKLICTLLKPQSGRIYYDGGANISAVRKKMGVSLDDSHLIPYFTVRENLSFYQKTYIGKYSHPKIDEWLEIFQIEKYAEHPIEHLSKGAQKKVSIIKALMHQPDILIFDEPTNSLDPASKKILGNIFKDVSADRLLVVSSHDPEWTTLWSNKTIRIQDGVIS